MLSDRISAFAVGRRRSQRRQIESHVRQSRINLKCPAVSGNCLFAAPATGEHIAKIACRFGITGFSPQSRHEHIGGFFQQSAMGKGHAERVQRRGVLRLQSQRGMALRDRLVIISDSKPCRGKIVAQRNGVRPSGRRSLGKSDALLKSPLARQRVGELKSEPDNIVACGRAFLQSASSPNKVARLPQRHSGQKGGVVR